jgi:hypothetical protein
MSKTQDFLQNRKIIDVIHSPQKLTLVLDDGKKFEIKAYATGWEVESHGLDFKFFKSDINRTFLTVPG